MSTRKRQPPLPASKPPTGVFTMRLPVDLVVTLDAIAAKESRSRARQIEVALREFVQGYQRRTAA